MLVAMLVDGALYIPKVILQSRTANGAAARSLGERGVKLGPDIAAVITGGASGLGLATAKALRAQGVKVALFDKNAEIGPGVAEEIGAVFWCSRTRPPSYERRTSCNRSRSRRPRVGSTFR